MIERGDDPEIDRLQRKLENTSRFTGFSSFGTDSVRSFADGGRLDEMALATGGGHIIIDVASLWTLA